MGHSLNGSRDSGNDGHTLLPAGDLQCFNSRGPGACNSTTRFPIVTLIRREKRENLRDKIIALEAKDDPVNLHVSFGFVGKTKWGLQSCSHLNLQISESRGCESTCMHVCALACVCKPPPLR